MHSKVVLGENFFQRGLVANVGFEQTVVRIRFVAADVRAFDCRIVEVVEVVDDRNPPLAFREQTIDQMRTDEACAACD